MIPLVNYERELTLMRELVVRIAGQEGMREGVDYTVGTMIELPRACAVADHLAEHADFFSFGTNDLTQTALGFSRDDIERKILGRYINQHIVGPRRSRRSTAKASACSFAWRSPRPCRQPEHRAGRVRRARWRPRIDRLLRRRPALTTCPVHRSACRWPASPPHRQQVDAERLVASRRLAATKVADRAVGGRAASATQATHGRAETAGSRGPAPRSAGTW